jgi:putative oxidoreductase
MNKKSNFNNNKNTMKSKILFVISLLFGLLFINGGMNKLFHYIPTPKGMPADMVKLTEALESVVWLMPLIAVVEIIGGVLVIIPRFRALGAVMIFPILSGICLTHIFNDTSGLPMAFILMVINIWILVENKKKVRPLFK